ncbi:MAG: hypothetical protein FWE91_01970 [Defluviitaleaceae bacterium]|nr:hypothetical protein [Defluviitaleaceae bacterium]MCL2836075.1 hypothetical protein [Defluviitaleaceae bacterium]
MVMPTAVKTQRMVGVAILTSLTVVFQVFATAINFVTPGAIPFALAVPLIVIGAAMYGPRAAALQGFCFGLVVLGSGIMGVAPTSAMMWGISPVIMTAGTLGRGLAAGLTAGLVYKALARKETYFGVLGAAIITPVVNTSIFVVVLFLFSEVLIEQGAGRTIFQYASGIMIGFNFFVELVVNIALATNIDRIIGIVKKKRV